MPAIEVMIYKTINDKEPFYEWLDKLDKKMQTRILNRLKRIQIGNFGDCKTLQDADEIKEIR